MRTSETTKSTTETGRLLTLTFSLTLSALMRSMSL